MSIHYIAPVLLNQDCGANLWPSVLDVATYCERFGMEYSEYLGSKEFIDQIAQVLESQHNIPNEFLIVQPGETLKQDMFR